MDRFTDLLFPVTIKFKNQQTSRKKKGKEMGQKEGYPRDTAKRTLRYWIRLGEPLLGMVQRFGHGILLLLPKDLTDKK
jgi:hypothetical protein